MKLSQTQKTIIENIIGIIFFGTVFIIGVLLHALWLMAIMFAVFGIMNAVLDKLGYKQHAESIGNIPGWVMCFFTSNIILLICLYAVKLFEIHLPDWESIILGILIVVFWTLGVSKLFYFKPRNEPRKHDFIANFIRSNKLGEQKNAVIERFEKLLKDQQDNRLLIIYQNMFCDNKSYKTVCDILGIESRILSELIDKIIYVFAHATIEK